jgi:DNA-directed RNA polymerase
MTTDDLMKTERDLEVEAIGLGQARYLAQKQAAEDKTEPGRTLLRGMIPPTATAIDEWTNRILSGVPSPGATLGKFLSMFDPADVAFITCRQALLAFGGDQRLVPNALQLTKNLEDAAASDALQSVDPKGFKRLRTKIEKARLPNKRYVLVRKAEQKAKVERINWSISERVRLGQLLLDMCANATGAFDVELMRSGKQTVAVLRPAAKTIEWLDTAHNRCSLLAPLHLPMVVPPREWSNPYNGGYLETRAMRLKMINSRRVNKNYMSELAQEPMPLVYRALNALQATPWRINAGVRAVMLAAWDAGSTVGKLPSRESIPMPAAPWGDGPAPDRESKEWKDHNGNLGRTHEANEKMISRRKQMASKLWIAERFADFEAIYFPHVLDWRGRMYPVPAHLNPQVEDSGKALLEFANGAALGDDGAFWLAVHGANSYGVDKVPFDQRVEWVEKNQDAILDSAKRPLEGEPASGPTRRTPTCSSRSAWSGPASWRTSPAASPRTPSCPTSRSAGMEAATASRTSAPCCAIPSAAPRRTSCPARRPRTSTSAWPTWRPSRWTQDAAKGEVNAAYWLGKVTRKIAKRPTMTLPYGSGRYGFRDQLREELDKMRLDNDKPYIEGDEFLCSLYLANVLYDALGQVVVAARQAMDWLQEVANVAAQENLPLWWTSPAGLRVMQDYKETKGLQVSCVLSGKRVQMTLQVETSTIDKRKQAQGISPNFVHSLDAAHLMRTVVKCQEAGITSFAMVHDSYGTHAGNAGACATCCARRSSSSTGATRWRTSDDSSRSSSRPSSRRSCLRSHRWATWT